MVYKYKDKSDAAKGHSAPAPGRRVSYSRADNKTYRNTGGASTRAGAELRAKQTFGVPGTDGAEKKKSRKKRVIKRFAIATAVRTINDKKEEQASSNAAAEATEQIQRRMHDAAYVGVELAAKPVRKAARSLYRSADSVVKDYRARKSVVRTAQRYRSADGKARIRLTYKSTRENKNIRRVKVKQYQKYRIRTAHGATTPRVQWREQFMPGGSGTTAPVRAKAAAKKKVSGTGQAAAECAVPHAAGVRHLRCTVQRGIKQVAAYTARPILHRQRYALYSSVKPQPLLIMRGCGKLLRSAAKRVCATASRRAKLV